MRKNFIEKQLHTPSFTNQHVEQGERGMLKNYFIDELRSLYWIEKYLLKNLSKIQSVAHTLELQESLEDHSSVTDDHVERIEQLFTLLGEIAQVRKSEAMDSTLKEISHLCFRLEQNSFTKDLAIVSAINKMQYYQIATYQNLIHVAHILREKVIEGILQRSLDDERKAMEVFSSILRTHLNETNLLETESES
jgi:ferritin-like metal-binding protein YciE